MNMKNLAARGSHGSDRPNALAGGKKAPAAEGIIKRMKCISGNVAAKGKRMTIEGEVYGHVRVHAKGKIKIVGQFCGILTKPSDNEAEEPQAEGVMIRGKPYGSNRKDPEKEVTCEVKKGEELTIRGTLYGNIEIAPKAHFTYRVK